MIIVAVSKIKWFFGTEKVNAVILRIIEIAMVEDLINNGFPPDKVINKGRVLGNNMGDLLFIFFHSKLEFVAKTIHDLPKFLREFYIFLFGEKPNGISLETNNNQAKIRISSLDGFPTCRGLVSPHPKIKFGFYFVGILDRLLGIMKDELSIQKWRIEENKCVSTGDDRCEITIQIELSEEIEVVPGARKKV